MRPIKQIPNVDLRFALRRLVNISHEVAYAKSSKEAEYFAVHCLRPLLEEVEPLLGIKFNNEQKINSKLDPHT